MEFVYIGKGKQNITYKIGRTDQLPAVRLRQHRTANQDFNFEVVFETLDSKGLETLLHRLFGSKRVPGTREWFTLALDDLALANQVASRFEDEFIPLREGTRAYERKPSSDKLLRPDSYALKQYDLLLTLRERNAWGQYEEELCELRLKEIIALDGGLDGRVRWSYSEPRMFDIQSFRREYPHLYENFCRPTPRRSFRVL